MRFIATHTKRPAAMRNPQKYSPSGGAALRVALFLCILWHTALPASAQELNCSLQVNSQKIQGTNRSVFEEMQRTLYEFMNNTAWTPHTFATDERIECTVMLTLTEQLGSDEYKGQLTVQSRRPVYGTTYNTPILNFLDENLQFKYIEGQKLEFSESSHLSNLTSILAFYAYIIIGYDYDTFAPLGGTPFFAKAEQIVQNAQNAPERGWRAYEGKRRNRYWLADNMVNDKYRTLRRASYTYHRRGLDIMAEKIAEGRTQVLNSVLALQELYRQHPDPEMLALQLFLEVKRDEIVNIFSEAQSAEKSKVANALIEIDATNSSRYQQMMKSGSGR